MTRDELKNHIDFAQARIEEIERKVINTEPEQKGYREIVEGYNSWINRYKELTDKLEHYDDADEAYIEMEKLELEKEKVQINQEIEQDKNNLKAEELRLEREKFAHEVEQQKSRELKEDIFEAVELAGKLLVPIAGLTGVIYVANLAYMNDSKLELCNGRVIGGVKDLLKVMTMKV